MKRRDVIKRTAVILGVAISAPTAMSILSGCKTEPTSSTWKPLFFSKEQAEVLTHFAERIIPETDTPGARSVGVHKFIDETLANNYTQKEQDLFLEKLNTFSTDCQTKYNKAFSKLTPEQQDEYLSACEKASIELGQTADLSDDHYTFFSRMKELSVAGFCNSEIAAKQFFNYDPIPGDYKGCIPLSEVKTTWAL